MGKVYRLDVVEGVSSTVCTRRRLRVDGLEFILAVLISVDIGDKRWIKEVAIYAIIKLFATVGVVGVIP